MEIDPPENPKDQSDKVAEAVNRLKGMKDVFSKVEQRAEHNTATTSDPVQSQEQQSQLQSSKKQEQQLSKKQEQQPSKKQEKEATDKSSEDTVSVPLARVKRIIRQDDQIMAISSGASYSVAAAVELFIKYMAEQAYIGARANKRKKIQYNDLAIAIQRQPELEFLSVLVPKTVPYKAIKDKVTKQDENADPASATSEATSKAKQSTIGFAPRAN